MHKILLIVFYDFLCSNFINLRNVVVGTAGNTGIGLAHLCLPLGFKCVIFIPDDQAKEKIDMLKGKLFPVHCEMFFLQIEFF